MESPRKPKNKHECCVWVCVCVVCVCVYVWQIQFESEIWTI